MRTPGTPLLGAARAMSGRGPHGCTRSDRNGFPKTRGQKRPNATSSDCSARPARTRRPTCGNPEGSEKGNGEVSGFQGRTSGPPRAAHDRSGARAQVLRPERRLHRGAVHEGRWPLHVRALRIRALRATGSGGLPSPRGARAGRGARLRVLRRLHPSAGGGTPRPRTSAGLGCTCPDRSRAGRTCPVVPRAPLQDVRGVGR